MILNINSSRSAVYDTADGKSTSRSCLLVSSVRMCSQLLDFSLLILADDLGHSRWLARVLMDKSYSLWHKLWARTERL